MAAGKLMGAGVLMLLAACGADAPSEPDSGPTTRHFEPELGQVEQWVDAMSATAATPMSTPNHSVAPVSEMIGHLERRLEAQPNDLKGWTLLAQSFAFIGQIDNARAAAARAVELGASASEIEQQIQAAFSDHQR